MGLKEFLSQYYNRVETSNFDKLSEEELEKFLSVSKYGDFQLTDAIRPSPDLLILPQTGYRHDIFVDKENQIEIPVLMAAVSKELLFEVFIDLIDVLGETVDVGLETSHETKEKGHRDLYREGIDLAVLKSFLYEFEESLLNDGNLGIAVLNRFIPAEVQLEEHKMLILYGEWQEKWENVFHSYGIPQIEGMRFIHEAEHMHQSSDRFFEVFNELKCRLGLDNEAADDSMEER